jgi:hypothetical protein
VRSLRVRLVIFSRNDYDKVMKKLVLSSSLLLTVLCGCTQHYVMRLNSGLVVTTKGKPKLQGAFYHFKDAQGHDNVVAQSRVAEIAPASQAKRDEAQFKPPSYPKPKNHWWQFWR